MTEEERRVVAVHEAGHAVVALAMDEDRLPRMVSIIPPDRTLGRPWLTDTHDRLTRSRAALMGELATMLGGRAAEELVFGDAGAGVSGDLTHGGRLAHRMVASSG